LSQITVATLNLRNRQNRWLERRKLIVAELIDAQPDIISLQEVYRPIGQGRWLRNQINSRLSGSSKHPYQIVQKRRQHLTRGYFEGIAIISRLPIVAHDAVNLGYQGRVALRANIELPARDTLDFVAVHLHHEAEGRQARLEQSLQLTGWLNDHNPAQKQVIAGDFNETPDGPAVQLMKQTYRSAFEEIQGYDPIATYPTALISRSDGWSGCLDYVFISYAVKRVLSARLFCHRSAPEDPRLFPSDHVGLLVTLDVGQGAFENYLPANREDDSL
jgi:endonuclease/exonuclease/phosphatase family metal-dependent hydrolase